VSTPDIGEFHSAIQQTADAATLLSPHPMAIFRVAIAIAAFRTDAPPRWLATVTAVTAAALAVNRGFLGAEAVPAMLVLLFWTLIASVYLFATERSPVVDVQEPINASLIRHLLRPALYVCPRMQSHASGTPIARGWSAGE
jgi:hypothetical protein